LKLFTIWNCQHVKSVTTSFSALSVMAEG